MTLFLLLTIIFLALFIVSVIVWVKLELGYCAFCISSLMLGLCIIFGLITALQPLTLREEMLTHSKERQQIIYQIENLKETTNTLALNEAILKYNSWVDEVNLNKEIYGWASWYHSVDMSEHTIIKLQ